ALSARPGGRIKAGRTLPADLPQPDGRFASAAPAPASVRDRGDLRKANRGHHQGYGGGSVVRPGERGLHGRSARRGAAPLAAPAAYGLWLHGAAEVRLRPTPAVARFV